MIGFPNNDGGYKGEFLFWVMALESVKGEKRRKRKQKRNEKRKTGHVSKLDTLIC